VRRPRPCLARSLRSGSLASRAPSAHVSRLGFLPPGQKRRRRGRGSVVERRAGHSLAAFGGPLRLDGQFRPPGLFRLCWAARCLEVGGVRSCSFVTFPHSRSELFSQCAYREPDADREPQPDRQCDDQPSVSVSSNHGDTSLLGQLGQRHHQLNTRLKPAVKQLDGPVCGACARSLAGAAA
jgi:hypothetical protein